MPLSISPPPPSVAALQRLKAERKSNARTAGVKQQESNQNIRNTFVAMGVSQLSSFELGC